MSNGTDVALILCNSDTIDLISFVLLAGNLSSCGIEPSEGEARAEELIASHRPSVVVFDLDPPYRRSTAVLKRLLNRFPHLAFVLTCADPTLAVRAAPWLSCHPIFQKPYEPQHLGEMVNSMVRRSANHVGKKVVAVGDFCRTKW